jgi:hypothetical protein
VKSVIARSPRTSPSSTSPGPGPTTSRAARSRWPAACSTCAPGWCWPWSIRRAPGGGRWPSGGRRPVYLVGPDNGLLASAWAVGGATAVELTSPTISWSAGATSPVGTSSPRPPPAMRRALDALGPRVDVNELVPAWSAARGDGAGGRVLWVDRYGLPAQRRPREIDGWGDRVQVRWTRPHEGVRTARRATAYEGLAPGQWASWSTATGSCRSASPGSAAETLGLAAGDELAWSLTDGDDREPGDNGGHHVPGQPGSSPPGLTHTRCGSCRRLGGRPMGSCDPDPIVLAVLLA